MGSARFSGQVCHHNPTYDRGPGIRPWSGPRAASVLGVLILSVAGMSALPEVPAWAAPSARSLVPHGTRTVEAAPRVPAGARPAGAVRLSAVISGDLVLKPRDNAAVTRFIADVTDKNSPLFHRYLPAGAYASRFGPSRATISAATSVLRADGLHVTGVSADHLLIHFRGTARTIGTAFHTTLESYRLRDGFIGRTATSAVRLPARIAWRVAAVLGLDNLVQEQPLGLPRAPASDRGKIRPPASGELQLPRRSAQALQGRDGSGGQFRRADGRSDRPRLRRVRAVRQRRFRSGPTHRDLRA